MEAWDTCVTWKTIHNRFLVETKTLHYISNMRCISKKLFPFVSGNWKMEKIPANVANAL